MARIILIQQDGFQLICQRSLGVLLEDGCSQGEAAMVL